MARENGTPKKDNSISLPLASVTVDGFKSLYSPCRIAVRPLTLLAGANSSGKSSQMQPVLMMKQTLAASYDPGALQLLGPNVKVTSRDQILSRRPRQTRLRSFGVTLETFGWYSVALRFLESESAGLEVSSMECKESGGPGITLRSGMTPSQIWEAATENREIDEGFHVQYEGAQVVRNRCFLGIAATGLDASSGPYWPPPFYYYHPISTVALAIRSLIHLPGLRGNPEREYPATSVGAVVDGHFQNYAPSVILHWQEKEEISKVKALGDAMRRLGLTWKVEAKRINDAQIQINVGRLLSPARGGAQDMVNIADVGVGVSQVLPVVVALIAAVRGQVVYIEEPEIHLHPRAQVALAGLLVEAAKRGVRVIAETHSDLLLRGVQTQIAQGSIAPSEVALHWFSRDKTGATSVKTAELDEAGRFGDWPSDFTDVFMEAEDAYLTAVEKRHSEAG